MFFATSLAPHLGQDQRGLVLFCVMLLLGSRRARIPQHSLNGMPDPNGIDQAEFRWNKPRLQTSEFRHQTKDISVGLRSEV